MKGVGYLISMASVVLLAVPAWRGARDDSTLMMCLLGGAAASMVGMILRWLSYRREHREKDTRLR